MFKAFLERFWWPSLWKRLAQEEAIANSMIKDWADDHDYLCQLCERAGCPEKEIMGDSRYVPGIQDLADRIAWYRKIDAII